jgi:CBS domain-containing protein
MVKPVESARSIDTLEEVLQKMVERNVGCLVILDQLKPVGIVTERDISRIIAKGPSLLKLVVGSVMSSPVIFLSPIAPIVEACVTMLSYGIRRLPIIEKGHLVGLVTERDLLHWVIKIGNEPRIPAEIQEILKKPLASKL